MAKKKTTKTKPEDMEIPQFIEPAAEAAPEGADAASETTEAPVEKAPKKIKVRGKTYQEKRALVDKTKSYSPAEAVELLKRMSYSKFVGTLEAHLQVKDVGMTATLTFPHSTGKTVRVAIMNDEIIEQLTKGVIEFDVLVARPEDMRNITKFARLLGPKGLMPNPKNGTITPTPEKKKKELEAGAVTLKTEKKAPLIHLSLGKLSMSDKELVENIEALMKAFELKMVRLYISASMSPSVRVTTTA